VQVAKLATPKPAPKPSSTDTPKPSTAPKTASDGSAAATTTDGPGDAATIGTKGGAGAPGGERLALRLKYGDTVGGRFKATAAPRKPVSVEGNNREYTALMRFRIARDGSVLSVILVNASGNQLVDDWIRTTIPDFQRVPPPPAELLTDGVYEDSMEVIYEL
jgi:protein TonB